MEIYKINATRRILKKAFSKNWDMNGYSNSCKTITLGFQSYEEAREGEKFIQTLNCLVNIYWKIEKVNSSNYFINIRFGLPTLDQDELAGAGDWEEL